MSNDSKKTASSGGIGFFGLLGVAFIVLKLCGVINWPWIWVLAPIWGGILITLGILGIIFAVIFILGLIKELIK